MSKTTLNENLDIDADDLIGNDSFGLEARLLSSENSVSLPSLSFASSATYSRDGDDLVLTLEGEIVVVENYFSTPTPPTLTTMDGAVFSPELIASFLPQGDTQDFYVSSLLRNLLNGNKTLDNNTIAVIESLTGAVLVIRNGKATTLKDGDQLYQGDKVSTSIDSSANMIFSDGTQFKIGSEARISLDEFSFESSTSQGLQLLSVLSGAFSYISGLVAKDDPANVQLRTPFGEIGIRGTKIVGVVDAEKAEASITLMEGRILYTTPRGEEYEISQGFDTLTIKNGGEKVKETTLSAERTARSYDVFEDAGEVSNFLQQAPATQQNQGTGNSQDADAPLPDISYDQAQQDLIAQKVANAEIALEGIGILSDSQGYVDNVLAVAQAELYRQEQEGNNEDSADLVGIEDYSVGSSRGDSSSSSAGAFNVWIDLRQYAGQAVLAEATYDLKKLGDIFIFTNAENVEVTFTRGYLEQIGEGGRFIDLIEQKPETILYEYNNQDLVTGSKNQENPDSERGITGVGNEGRDLSVEVTFDDVTGDGVRDTFRLIFRDYFPSDNDNVVAGIGRDTEIYSIQLPNEPTRLFSDFAVEGTTAF